MGSANFLVAGIEMAVAAGEIVAGVAVVGRCDLRADMRVGGGDQIATAPHQPTVLIVRERSSSGTVQMDRLAGPTPCAMPGLVGNTVHGTPMAAAASMRRHELRKPCRTRAFGESFAARDRILLDRMACV